MALGAGAGRRMLPLTRDRPKVLLPVDGTPLIDHAIERLRTAADGSDARVVVNAHESQGLLREHLDARGDVDASVEQPAGLGTAGALAAARPLLDGRDVLVVNGDTWCPGSLRSFVDGWDRERFRILVPGGGPMTPRSKVAAALLPWSVVRRLEIIPSGIWEVCWRDALDRVETVAHDGDFVDCADVGDYLRANLAAAGGSVVGDGCVVHGEIEDVVLWSGAVVRSDEVLKRAVRTGDGRTVLVRT